jgi:AcrR family transcriptional regulator
MSETSASSASGDPHTPAQGWAGEPPPKSQPRVRLEVDARRAQLLKLGRDLIAGRAYDELSIGEIARAAGISKGLLYHYFPSKRAFYVESFREAAIEFLLRAGPRADLPPLERLGTSIDAYLTFVEQHKDVFSALLLPGSSRDSEVLHIAEGTRLQFLDELFKGIAQSPIGRNALCGWVGFIEASVLDWIEHADLTRREVFDLSIAVLQPILQCADLGLLTARGPRAP